MMISSSIMIEKQAMKIEKYSHKKSRFCLIQKKLDISCPELLSIVVYGVIPDVSFAAILMPPVPLP